MKRIIIVSILTVGLVTGVAFAHNSGFNMMGYGGHMGGGYGMMGPNMMGGNFGNGGYGACTGPGWNSQNSWNSEKHQKFLKDSVELRKEMNEKRFEYWEAQRNPDTTKEQFSKLEKDMTDIHTKLGEIAQKNR